MIITSDSKDVKSAPQEAQHAPNDAGGSSKLTLRPLLFGYETQVKPNGKQTPHVCPKCNHASVFSSTSTEQIVVMFVAVSSSVKASWLCTTEKCGWSTPLDREPLSWEPSPPYIE
ncbi:hypothetical protein B0H14DRAFT_2792675 [Mycena olivaceomarginata]|nr:hypothetical protein B0H14DRAFT_2792675 [Mycena olivaceomarginata]